MVDEYSIVTIRRPIDRLLVQTAYRASCGGTGSLRPSRGHGVPRIFRRSCAALTTGGERGSRIGLPTRRLGLPQINRGGLSLISAFELEAQPLAFMQVADT
jgi:hypothetical protein